jgi:hypothetical protein
MKNNDNNKISLINQVRTANMLNVVVICSYTSRALTTLNQPQQFFLQLIFFFQVLKTEDHLNWTSLSKFHSRP